MENLTPNLRSVGKTKMAHLYHPCDTVSDMAARRWLNRKIQQNEHLLTLLERNGYNKYSHTFTSIQVILILNELGTPLSFISRKLIVTKSDILEVLGKSDYFCSADLGIKHPMRRPLHKTPGKVRRSRLKQKRYGNSFWY